MSHSGRYKKGDRVGLEHVSGKRIRLGSIPCNALEMQLQWPDAFDICQLINNGTDIVSSSLTQAKSYEVQAKSYGSRRRPMNIPDSFNDFSISKSKTHHLFNT